MVDLHVLQNAAAVFRIEEVWEQRLLGAIESKLLLRSTLISR